MGKANGEWRIIQDLQLVNEAVMPIHLVASNLYTLLTQFMEDTEWFTVLDLKDAFFYIPLHPNSQFLFAFEDPNNDGSQLTWTVLLQDFWDSPHFLRKSLRKGLRLY